MVIVVTLILILALVVFKKDDATLPIGDHTNAYKAEGAYTNFWEFQCILK